jgi:hypothetical protein
MQLARFMLLFLKGMRSAGGRSGSTVGWEMTKHIKDVVFPFIKDIHDVGKTLFSQT